jgi:hypothetical protein
MDNYGLAMNLDPMVQRQTTRTLTEEYAWIAAAPLWVHQRGILLNTVLMYGSIEPLAYTIIGANQHGVSTAPMAITNKDITL